MEPPLAAGPVLSLAVHHKIVEFRLNFAHRGYQDSVLLVAAPRCQDLKWDVMDDVGKGGGAGPPALSVDRGDGGIEGDCLRPLVFAHRVH